MRVEQFDFSLPDELIALRPVYPRDAARLLVVSSDGSLTHALVRDLPNYMRPGDSIVLNDTQVIPARLRGHRLRRSADAPAPKIEVMLHKRIAPDRFLAFTRPARKLEAGDKLLLGETISATVIRCGTGGETELAFDLVGEGLDTAIDGQGEIPLPPYIAGKRQVDARDGSDYQTVYAKHAGSVAAPTAGLHFTPELFEALDGRRVSRETVTLHVGAGTFLPVTAERTEDHTMHAEWASLSENAASRLNERRSAGGRIAAVGTTSLRTLESAADETGRIRAFDQETSIFITPGYKFRTADMLLTNFHLPRSTLFMLVCAFAGFDTMRAAYAQAIRQKYRFYSYGDACLLFRAPT